MIDVTHHWPPDMMNLVIEALVRLNRGKQGLIIFLRGAGVPSEDLNHVQAIVSKNPDDITKGKIARDVLARVNDRGDAAPAIRARREIVKRIVETQNFSGCWPDDLLAAKVAVTDLQKLVAAKDAFTRMKEAHDEERAQRGVEYERATNARREKVEAIGRVRAELFALYSESNVWQRGKAFEGILNRLFAAYGVSVREAFAVVGDGKQGVVEQIDGVIVLDGALVMVEAKWTTDPIDVNPISRHLVRLVNRPPGTRGLILSHAPFTEPGVAVAQESLGKLALGLCELKNIVMLLQREEDVAEYLRDGFRRLVIDKRPEFPVA